MDETTLAPSLSTFLASKVRSFSLALLIAAYSTLGLVTSWARGNLVGVSASVVVLVGSVGVLASEWITDRRRG